MFAASLVMRSSMPAHFELLDVVVVVADVVVVVVLVVEVVVVVT